MARSEKKESDQQAFGDEVRRRRRALGYSQEDFAHQFGFNRTYYSSVERGEYNLSLANALKIIRALGTKPSEFFKSLDHIPADPPTQE